MWWRKKLRAEALGQSYDKEPPALNFTEFLDHYDDFCQKVAATLGETFKRKKSEKPDKKKAATDLQIQPVAESENSPR